MKPELNKRHHQLKSNYSTSSVKINFPKILIKQSKTTQPINKLKKDSIIFLKNRRRRILKIKKTNILHHSPLTIIPRLKRTTRLNQRLVPHTIDHDDNLDANSSLNIKSDNSSTSSLYQPSHSSMYDESIHSSFKTKF